MVSWCNLSFAGPKKWIGTGDFKFDESGVESLYRHATGNQPSKAGKRYGDIFYVSPPDGTGAAIYCGGPCTRYKPPPGFEGWKIFALKNKIVWNEAKIKIPRKTSLEELKVILKELDFYDGD